MEQWTRVDQRQPTGEQMEQGLEIEAWHGKDRGVEAGWRPVQVKNKWWDQDLHVQASGQHGKAWTCRREWVRWRPSEAVSEGGAAAVSPAAVSIRSEQDTAKKKELKVPSGSLDKELKGGLRFLRKPRATRSRLRG